MQETGDLGSILGLGRSPGERNVYPLQYSGLENYMVCMAHGVTNSQTQLSDFHFQGIHEQIKAGVVLCKLGISALTVFWNHLVGI